MNPLTQSWLDQDDNEPPPEQIQAYIDEFVTIMTEAIDEKHQPSTKINNGAYTDNLTTSGDGALGQQVLYRADLQTTTSWAPHSTKPADSRCQQ